tara:strand:+ start:1406 stop:2218 length:813 start_codon:yes stop_codon:yes gene_type:complete
MTNQQNIIQWLKSMESPLDPYTVSSNGLYLGTLEYYLPEQEYRKLNLDTPMAPLIINEAKIIGESHLDIKLPPLSKTRSVFLSQPVAERRLQTGAWLRNIVQSVSGITAEIGTSTIDDIGTEVCYQNFTFADASQDPYMPDNQTELNISDLDNLSFLQDSIAIIHDQLEVSSSTDLRESAIRIWNYNAMASHYHSDFFIGGVQSTDYFSGDSIPNKIGIIKKEFEQKPKIKHTIHTYILDDNGFALAHTKTVVQVPSPMREGGYHAISGN